MKWWERNLRGYRVGDVVLCDARQAMVVDVHRFLVIIMYEDDGSTEMRCDDELTMIRMVHQPVPPPVEALEEEVHL